MAVRIIIKEGDPVLRKISRPVEVFDKKLWDLLDDMAETMEEANGVGLAAPQVGILRRVITINTGEGLIELVNPEIIRTTSHMIEAAEGCLSSPGEYGIVPRPEKVKVRAYNRHGKPFEIKGEELLARAFCHEIDHLDGKLFKDLVIRMLDPDEEE